MAEEERTENVNATIDPNVEFLLRLKQDCDDRRRQQRQELVFYTVDEPWCPTVFDGWACWDATPPGTRATVPCPKFVTGFDPARTAYRSCLQNGTWFRHPSTGRPWSNYTTCVDLHDLAFREIVNNLYITGYSISFAALLISLIIFFTFRSLRCTRIAIHVHLFLSFAGNDLAWLVWYHKVVGNPSVISQNLSFCQVLHVVIQYLMVANYFWMFCEGLHLHLALVVVFVKDNWAMRWFYFLGWGVPVLITALYASVRYQTPEDTYQCWMNDSYTQWILTVPVCLSMLASLAFLINVVRVLLTKLHCNSANPAPIGLRKAVRAALILVPLFGIHHILIPFRPEPHSSWEKVYQIFSAVMVSSQGFCVSVLFCFANVDVHSAFKAVLRRLNRRNAAHENLTMATQTREVV
ncbi:calcitonin gene-related peptide type 1 receptor-like [Macrosteles quadrilineatus]|uniref:calcitonin gene-related peptide type 1 receptor-like n=1 Tax=Macrosteles quadrilineatus TaxID=74068 RepID=UPI0023E1BD7D|nr:calcitonin gene-related peptide type 1 receptor-like [Macrosteles quadrilineatus]